MAGPGSGLSEELVWGCEPAALESESLPRCPPGLVLVLAGVGDRVVEHGLVDDVRQSSFQARIASIEVLPSALAAVVVGRGPRWGCVAGRWP